MGEDSSASPHDDDRDEGDEDDYEEVDGGNCILGFMFGNVNDSGGLDVDYLDEDAKEHLGALADKLGPSLRDIDLSIKSRQIPSDYHEQDYDEKAEDAVDYEDIEEQYEGPEIEILSEADHLLPKKEFLSAELSSNSFQHNTSVFDEENYDEDEDIKKEHDVVADGSSVKTFSSEVKNLELRPDEECSYDTMPSLEYFNPEDLTVDLEDFAEGTPELLKDSFTDKSTRSLPILCVEHGMVVLKFSEIFGIHEPLKNVEKKNHMHSTLKEKHKGMDACDNVEEDEEIFLRRPCGSLSKYDVSLVRDGHGVAMNQTVTAEQREVTCFSAQPMKESVYFDLADGLRSPSCPKFYALDQHEWEDEIVWENSPVSGSCQLSEVDCEGFSETEKELRTGAKNLNSELQVEYDKNDHGPFLGNCPVLVESLGYRNFLDTHNLLKSERNHPQLLRLESPFKADDSSDSEVQKENTTRCLRKNDATMLFSKLPSQNTDVLDGSWLDNIIWEPNVCISKPRLILDLQDERMCFELVDTKDNEHLRFHAGAMIITGSTKSNCEDSIGVPGKGGVSIGRFDISNDKYYYRKASQQFKSHSKKRAVHGLKVLHSIPALKLQTMKPKLSNKDIANFHRPKAVWFPHDNEVVVKEQGKLSAKGPMKIIVKSIGGKGSKLNVDAEETVSSVREKASKKLDFKLTEKVKIVYSGKELDDAKSLALQNVRPNSVLHLVRTSIHLLPHAQKLPGETKSLRPPGAFKKKSDLSVKDGHVFLMEYCEARPLLLGNVGMGARLCTYYQKSAPGDQTASVLRNGNGSTGAVLTLDPTDKSPFLGDIRPDCSQSCLETNMYRAPIFPQKVPTTDYLLVRSAKGKLSLRRIDRTDVVGQQEPHMEVISPGSKSLQTYNGNRLLVYMYRECRANEKRGLPPCVRADELSAQFPNFSEPVIRKRLKHCADLQKWSNGLLLWVIRPNFRIPLEEELRRMVTPENVCSYESMRAGLYRLKRLGISRLAHPTGLSSAMNQIPDEALVLAAASHIERELLITPWNLTSNFIACINQDRENIERLEITGVGDPSGRGLGFSYVRSIPKAPIPNVVKKKTAAVRVGLTVTGTDADLRRLSMKAAREVLLRFNVPEEQIAKQTRWHRIAMIRKLSSEQAASGVKIDATHIGKYARGQRMSFHQLQQQTREKCQEIWDRQLRSLSADDDGYENESGSEANSDLDSFAGDLESFLDAEELGEAEVHNYELKHDKADSVRGLKMRKHPTSALVEEEFEDEAAEAAELCRMLMDDGETDHRKNKRTRPEGTGVGFTSNGKGEYDVMHLGLLKEPEMTADGYKVFKEKKQTGKPVREGYACGACGQPGHMRTNKNCPRYGEDLDFQVGSCGTERIRKPNSQDSSAQLHSKPSIKKIIPKMAPRVVTSEAPESAMKIKTLSLKLKGGSDDKPHEQVIRINRQNSDKIDVDADAENRSVSKITKLIISNSAESEVIHSEPRKPTIIIRPPVDIERQQPPKKIVIRQPKVDSDLQEDYRTKMVNLSSFEMHREHETKLLAEEAEAKRKAEDERRFWEEEKKRRFAERMRRIHEEQQRLAESRRYSEVIPREREEQVRQKKKKRLETDDDYQVDLRECRTNRRNSERNRSAKRGPVVDLETYGPDYSQQNKRRRGGEGQVGLSNILNNILDGLKGASQVSFLFQKPVSKKEAPDYLDIVKYPMDLSKIREKTRKMEYKSRDEFRHDIWQITYNAHLYNDSRNPGIPPLADQLLELCEYLLNQNCDRLNEAEAGIT